MRILHNEREIYIENFYFGYTYAGFLLGKPDRKMNERIIAEIKPPAYWPYHSFIKVSVGKEIMESKLPSCYYHAVMSSSPMNSEFCGSGFVLTWLAHHPDDKSIVDIVAEGIKQIVWEECAKDFDF